MPNIVDVIVTQQQAPLPDTLQSTGAFVSQGGTVLAPGTSSVLTQLSDLSLILTLPAAISTLSWSASVVSVTTVAPHGYPVGDGVWITISGAVPTGYNGTYLASVTGASAFMYQLGSNPGAETTPGTYVTESTGELQQMANTFFAQGVNLAVFVLELGPGGPDAGVAALAAYLVQNPNTAYVPGSTGFFYRYLIPRTWDGNANLLNLIEEYSGPTAKTYFDVTATLDTWSLYNTSQKSAMVLVESPAVRAYPANALTGIVWAAGTVTATTTIAHGVSPGTWFQIQGCVPTGYNGYHLALPGTAGNVILYALGTNPGAETTLGTLVASQVTSSGIPSTEFTMAWPFWRALQYAPSPTNRVTPFAFNFGFGVTPFPTRGFSALFTSLLAAGVNYAGTGAEGGVSNVILRNGTMMDGRDLTYWYSVDWAQLNSDLNLSNAVINGSNNPANPLYFNQDGINRLQDNEVSTMNSAVTFGLATGVVTTATLSPADFTQALLQGKFAGQIVVNAVPLLEYITANPGDYRIGRYAGLSVNYIVSRGFIHIILNLNVTDFLRP